MPVSQQPCALPSSAWAFNRDVLLGRQIEALQRRHGLVCACETGTWKGHTTVALAALFPRVYTIELDAARVAQNAARFSGHPNIVALQGHSPEVLVRLVDSFEYPLFAYLDAHWNHDDWPLRDELKILLSVRRPKVLMVHDFKVPGRDFGYDTYKGVACALDMIADLLPHDECRYRFNAQVAPQSERRGALFIEHLLG